MAYKVFRKIEVGGGTRRGWEKGRREIILNAKQNSYFNSDLSLGGQARPQPEPAGPGVPLRYFWVVLPVPEVLSPPTVWPSGAQRRRLAFSGQAALSHKPNKHWAWSWRMV